MTFRGPGGEVIPVVDVATVGAPVWSLGWVAESSSIHQYDVYASAKAPTGRYEIWIAELRQATEDDRELQRAQKLWMEFWRLHRQGKHLEARPFLIRSLEIREKVLGPDNLAVAELLGQLAGNYGYTGDHASAEPLRLRELKITEKALGPDHPAVAAVLNHLGSLYRKKGDDLKAEEVCLKALDIFERAQQAETYDVASLSSALGSIYYARGDYENAEKYYQRSRAVLEKIFGPDHFHLTGSFSFLGRVAYDAGDYAKAEAMFQRALTLGEKALGQDHLDVTSYRNDLATVYGTTGDYAKAEALYRQALSTHEQKAALSHPVAQETLYGLSRLYAARGMPSEAVKFQSRASELEERYVGLNLAVGSEREKLAFLDKRSLRSSRNISLHTDLAPNDSTARDLAVTTILRRKGRVQDAMSETLAALRRRSGAEEQKLLDQLNDATSKLAKLVLNGPQKVTPAQHQEQIKKLEVERERLEAEISRRSAGFYERSQPVTLAAVQTAIPADAALVEFAVYHPFDPKAPDNQKAYGESHYVAYVMRNQGDVQWKELGEAKEVDERIAALRQALLNPKRNNIKQFARAVDEKVMQPVRPLVGDAARLLVSPDGALNLIPFEALVDEQGKYLVERYSFNYLTSGRDLLRLQVARASQSQPLVLANPLFGEPELIALAKSNTPPSPRAALDRKPPGGTKRQSVTTGSDLSNVYFAPLTGTAQEARAIKSLFPEANTLLGQQATESSLKQNTAPRLLHIATHGFFLTGAPAAPAAGANPQATRAISASAKVENPLLRSGLALAGANLNKGKSDDGILTALEASGLNLWGTKLVTLSACDTGVGEVKNGEGVYGLRRAFVLAGTETLVMSLWPVSDYVTRELMTAYYQGLKQGQGRGAALRQVQLSLLKRRGREHPFYGRASFNPASGLT
jgi:CHAT domain-containing protein/Tfp pilus assembly protein PilF